MPYSNKILERNAQSFTSDKFPCGNKRFQALLFICLVMRSCLVCCVCHNKQQLHVELGSVKKIQMKRDGHGIGVVDASYE